MKNFERLENLGLPNFFLHYNFHVCRISVPSFLYGCGTFVRTFQHLQRCVLFVHLISAEEYNVNSQFAWPVHPESWLRPEFIVVAQTDLSTSLAQPPLKISGDWAWLVLGSVWATIMNSGRSHCWPWHAVDLTWIFYCHAWCMPSCMVHAIYFELKLNFMDQADVDMNTALEENSLTPNCLWCLEAKPVQKSVIWAWSVMHQGCDMIVGINWLGILFYVSEDRLHTWTSVFCCG